jgi:hypothetical protein
MIIVNYPARFTTNKLALTYGTVRRNGAIGELFSLLICNVIINVCIFPITIAPLNINYIFTDGI